MLRNSFVSMIDTWHITKRCSIKPKDEEAEIEMTGSQIKQEAPETNTFKMAEIKADDHWGLRSMHYASCTDLAAQHRRIFYVFG